MRIVLCSLLIACGADDGSGSASPAAPTDLVVSSVVGGGHLVWTDNSDNEDEFVIMRKAGTGAFTMIDAVPFNTTSYHDASITTGMTYTYKIVATNSGGEASSNEASFTP